MEGWKGCREVIEVRGFYIKMGGKSTISNCHRINCDNLSIEQRFVLSLVEIPAR
jgi:hypothetical protein